MAIARNQQLHMTIGSNQQLHMTIGSNQQQPMAIARNQQLHMTIGSNQQLHMTIGSNQQLHMTIGSNQQQPMAIARNQQLHMTIGSNQQQHMTIGSNKQQPMAIARNQQLHMTIGSNQQLHMTIGSNKQQSMAIARNQQLHMTIGNFSQTLRKRETFGAKFLKFMDRLGWVESGILPQNIVPAPNFEEHPVLRLNRMTYFNGTDAGMMSKIDGICLIPIVASPNDIWIADDLKYVKCIGDVKDGRQPLTVVTFRYDDDKYRIYKGRDELRKHNVRVGDDLTVKQRHQLKTLKSKGKVGYFFRGELRTMDSKTDHAGKTERAVKQARRMLDQPAQSTTGDYASDNTNVEMGEAESEGFVAM
ncbi:hypothetical protein MAR_020192, partial [Mya arenaria]